jgi:hypothetical protein
VRWPADAVDDNVGDLIAIVGRAPIDPDRRTAVVAAVGILPIFQHHRGYPEKLGRDE